MMGIPGVTPRFQRVNIIAKIKTDATDEQVAELVKMVRKPLFGSFFLHLYRPQVLSSLVLNSMPWC